MGDGFKMPGRDEFVSTLRNFDIAQEDFRKCPIKWPELVGIAEHHSGQSEQLGNDATHLANTLRRASEVHSIRMRIKNPLNLMVKIVRKQVDKKRKYLDLSIDNYQKIVTDLVGVRAIHLFKDDWVPIHRHIISNWKMKEQPVAIIRRGDPSELRRRFNHEGIKRVKEHSRGYRSVHYVVRCQYGAVSAAEVQVRTIFEEGWSEIDHLIRYPRAECAPMLGKLLAHINLLTGCTDDIGTSLRQLEKELANQTSQVRRTAEKMQVQLEQLPRTQRTQEIRRSVESFARAATETLSPEAMGHLMRPRRHTR